MRVFEHIKPSVNRIFYLVCGLIELRQINHDILFLGKIVSAFPLLKGVKAQSRLISILSAMTLLLGILFLALFISAIIRGKFTYGQADYDFHEHPIQFVIVLTFILGVAALCFYRFIVEL